MTKLRTVLSSPFTVPLFLIPLLSGCAAFAISALGTGAGVGVVYVIKDCADRTLNFPIEQVNRAAPRVLQNMDISVVNWSRIENGQRIRASAKELEITIDVQRITTRATRVTINAQKSVVLKDKATAEEIINQLERMLAKK